VLRYCCSCCCCSCYAVILATALASARVIYTQMLAAMDRDRLREAEQEEKLKGY